MFEWFKNIFRKEDTNDSDERSETTGTKFIWCLIGNIIDENRFGPDEEIKHGTKHFSPNTKVYCFPPGWSDGYEKIKVIGRHRKTDKNICLVMPSKLITNWRLQKVYRPYIIKVMNSQHGWTDSDEHKETILEILKSVTVN